MKQVVLEKPGVFTLGQTDEPHVGPGEVLVRVHRVGVCGTDLHAFAGRQPFFSYPRVLGHELGVEVLALGEGVSHIAVGDRGAVEPYLNCGQCIACRAGRTNCCASLQVMGVHCDGGMQPRLAVRADKLHTSTCLSLEQLALVETLGIGAHAVDRAQVIAGEAALVVGAGPIGLTVMQFLLIAGARVIAADVSEERLAFCRDALGVAHTVDAAAADLDTRLRDFADGDLPSVVFDATGHAGSMRQAFDRAAPGGRIVFVGLVQGDVSFCDPDFHRRELTLLASRNATGRDFSRIISLMESGRLDTTPWITHHLALADVPSRFAALPGSKGLIKAMVEVCD